MFFFVSKISILSNGIKRDPNLFYIPHTIFTEENNTKVELSKWKIIKTKQNIIAFIKKNNNGLNKYTNVFVKFLFYSFLKYFSLNIPRFF